MKKEERGIDYVEYGGSGYHIEMHPMNNSSNLSQTNQNCTQRNTQT
jgi:hypothetical protein